MHLVTFSLWGGGFQSRMRGWAVSCVSADLLTFTDLLPFGKKCIVKLNTSWNNGNAEMNLLVSTLSKQTDFVFSFKSLIFVMMTECIIFFSLEKGLYGTEINF